MSKHRPTLAIGLFSAAIAGTTAVAVPASAASGPSLGAGDGKTVQIKNVATGFCLDSGGETSSPDRQDRAYVYTFRRCTDQSENLWWEWNPDAQRFKNVATGYCLDSGGETGTPETPDRSPAYTYGDCGNPSDNLKWKYDSEKQQITNNATGFCLDSGGETSTPETPDRAPAYTYRNCDSSSDNLKWEIVEG